MGKTNYVILAIGIGGCLLLSMMMQHALKVENANVPLRVESEITDVYGQRFREPCTFKLAKTSRGPVGHIVVKPRTVGGKSKLVEQVGSYIWRNLNKGLELVELQVHVHGLDGKLDSFRVKPLEGHAVAVESLTRRRSAASKPPRKPTTKPRSSTEPPSRPPQTKR